MRLAPRLTLVFIGYAALLLIGVGFLAYDSGRDSLRLATISELQATAQEKESALTRWVREKQVDITTLAGDPNTIEYVSFLMTTSPASAEFGEVRARLIATIQPHLDSGEFLDVDLINPDTGQVIVSTAPEEEGKFREDRPFFLQGRNGPYVQNLYYSLSLQSMAMTASAPVRSPDGQLLGVMAGRLDLNEMNSIINRRTELHNTDDVFLVNTSGLFVTQPRFISNPAVLQRGVHTEDVRRCLQKESGALDLLDYRDVPVIAVYRWLPERDLCLVVKLDETEAYRPARAFGGTIMGISAVALLVAALIGSALAQGLTRPILALQAGAARFARGDLNTRLTESSRDELGQLASEFNKMAGALAEQQTYLRRRAEQFFSLTLDLLCTISPDGRLIDVNPAWEQILGYSRDELRGRLFTSIIHPDDLDLTRETLQRVKKGPTSEHFECRCRHKNGDYHWLAWSSVISPQDKLIYATARDITERRLAEEKLREQTEELERSNRELEQFAYVASHDLQEPLRVVASYVQLLSRRYQGKLDQDADEFIGFVVEGVARMKSLITDLLAYSRVGSRGHEFEPVEMEGVFKRVIGDMQIAIQDSSATVTHDPLPSVMGDDVLIAQLLQNLIGNAIKFCGPKPPRVHLGVRRQKEDWLFFVRDNGIGIDPRYKERVFVIFQRLHNRTEYTGTGIGLAICRKIVERHGGHIWVESEPGKGATFYFTLRPVESGPPEGGRPQRRDAVADRATDLV